MNVEVLDTVSGESRVFELHMSKGTTYKSEHAL